MSGKITEPASDEWSDWLFNRRHASDPEHERLIQPSLERIRDRVLDRAQLRENMTIADIGTGSGLIAFGAMDRIGPSLHVLLADVSKQLLGRAESVAIERGVRDQCDFLQCSAEKLDGIRGASVDVVITRAVLAYVSDRKAALGEFFRILKPGGRLSIAEPIFQDDAFEAISLRKMMESQPKGCQDPFLKLLHRWKSAQFPDTQELLLQNPIANYSERDLFRAIAGIGFGQVQLELQIATLPAISNSWEFFLRSSPHPWAPSLETIIEQQFSAEERRLFEQTLRPVVEGSQLTTTERIAYLSAIKPLL